MWSLTDIVAFAGALTDIMAFAGELWGTTMSACDHYWPSPCSVRLIDASSMRDKFSGSQAKLVAQSFAVHKIISETSAWTGQFEKGRIPRAKGILIAGPAKTGKGFLAEKTAGMLFDHCAVSPDPHESTFVEATHICSPIMDPSHGAILEIDIKRREYLDDATKVDSMNRMKKMIVEHQKRRKGLGSVVIMKHIDRLPIDVLDDFSAIMSGKSRTLSYYSPHEGKVSANTDGTLFLFTSKTWGARSIQKKFLEDRGNPTGSHRVRFFESIEKEINRSTDSNFGSVSIDQCYINFVFRFTCVEFLLMVCFGSNTEL